MLNADAFTRVFNSLSHFDATLGLTLQVLGPGDIRYLLPLDNRHEASAGHCHGGVIAAMMDATLGLTALTWAIPHNKLCATVEFKMNFLNRAAAGDTLLGTAQIDFTGTKLVVCHARITEQGRDTLVATGQGTFSLYPISRNPQLAALIAQME